MTYTNLGPDSADPRGEFAADLESGEQVVWADRPDPTSFARSGRPIVFIGVPFTAFAIFWMWGASGGMARGKSEIWPLSFFPLFGLPFLLMGLGMLTSPFWMRRSARRSAYAITNRRAIIRVVKFRGTIETKSFYPDRLTSIARTERTDGSGDLIFESFITRQGSGHTTTKRGFIGLRNVREVEALIQKTLLQRARGAQG